MTRNLQKLLHQFPNPEAQYRNVRLSVNDCFLRNMQKYKYIANFDIDEIIVPKDASTWSEMMKKIQEGTQNKEANIGSWEFRMIYFLDTMPTIGNESGVPSYLHMMQHVYRSKIYQPRSKSIINTDTALLIKQHTYIRCLDGLTCQRLEVEPKIAQTQHYRKEGVRGFTTILKSRKNIIKDLRILSNLENVRAQTQIALKNIFV